MITAECNSMQRLTIRTRRKREVIDITDAIQKLLSRKHSDKSGLCSLLVLHTTAALTTADLDPGTDLDMLDAFEAIIPSFAIGIRTIRRTSAITSCRH